jgi:hypothetical protein
VLIFSLLLVFHQKDRSSENPALFFLVFWLMRFCCPLYKRSRAKIPQQLLKWLSDL